ncbi:MAG TPA: hypothetical protein VKY82_02190 [Flavobacterium sp.]|nr:hypothetical protein [Flavobacterium sp.]
MEHFKMKNQMNKSFFLAIIILLSIPGYGQVSPTKYDTFYFNLFQSPYSTEGIKHTNINSTREDLKDLKHLNFIDLSTNVIDTSNLLMLTNLETLEIEPHHSDCGNKIYVQNLNLLGALLPKFSNLQYIEIDCPTASFLYGMSQCTNLEKVYIKRPDTSIQYKGWKGLKFLTYYGSAEFFDIKYMHDLDTLVLEPIENKLLKDFASEIAANTNLTTFFWEGMVSMDALKLISRNNLKSLFLSITGGWKPPLTINCKLLYFNSLETLCIDNRNASFRPVYVKNIHRLKNLKEVIFSRITLDSKMRKSKSIQSVELFIPISKFVKSNDSLMPIKNMSPKILPSHLSYLGVNFVAVADFETGYNDKMEKRSEFSLDFLKNVKEIDHFSISNFTEKHPIYQILLVQDERFQKLPNINTLRIEGNIDFEHFDEIVAQKKFAQLHLTDHLLQTHLDALCKSAGIDSLFITRSNFGEQGRYYNDKGEKIPLITYYYYKGNKQCIQQLSECLPHTEIIPEDLDIDLEDVEKPIYKKKND